MSIQNRRELIVLTADKNTEFTMRGILSRFQSLRIRHIEADIYVHPERDPGCFLESHVFLRPFSERYEYALVIFDRHGCGQEDNTREELERLVEERLHSCGWVQTRCMAVVLDPELEVLVWSDSPQVDRVLGWEGREPKLRQWLHDNGFWDEGLVKPRQPKEALEAALKSVRKPRSSALYLQLAQSVGFERCNDPAFNKLRHGLSGWFT